VADVAEKARTGRLAPEEARGSTFTITSLGKLGGLLATPIINHPEVAILGVHRMEDRAVVREGQVVVRKMMNLSLSFDHRVIDGHEGAAFAAQIKRYLEDPGLMLLEMA
jgi:pyruvate dehydrogenase E2 component (dihydrolipoamide acetyltransferase)